MALLLSMLKLKSTIVKYSSLNKVLHCEQET